MESPECWCEEQWRGFTITSVSLFSDSRECLEEKAINGPMTSNLQWKQTSLSLLLIHLKIGPVCFNARVGHECLILPLFSAVLSPSSTKVGDYHSHAAHHWEKSGDFTPSRTWCSGWKMNEGLIWKGRARGRPVRSCFPENSLRALPQQSLY